MEKRRVECGDGQQSWHFLEVVWKGLTEKRTSEQGREAGGGGQRMSEEEHSRHPEWLQQRSESWSMRSWFSNSTGGGVGGGWEGTAQCTYALGAPGEGQITGRLGFILSMAAETAQRGTVLRLQVLKESLWQLY